MPKQNKRLTWEDPPSRGGARAEFAPIAAKLRARKGQWAKVSQYEKSSTSASVAFMIRNGGITSFQPAGAYEAVARTVEGEHWVWARYIGEEKESERHPQIAPDGA